MAASGRVYRTHLSEPADPALEGPVRANGKHMSCGLRRCCRRRGVERDDGRISGSEGDPRPDRSLRASIPRPSSSTVWPLSSSFCEKGNRERKIRHRSKVGTDQRIECVGKINTTELY